LLIKPLFLPTLSKAPALTDAGRPVNELNVRTHCQ